MLAQVAPKVGDIGHNTTLVLEAMRQAEDAGVDVVVLPELVITGYPPEDLLYRPAFMEAVEQASCRVVSETRDVAVIFGHPRRTSAGLKNGATLARNGQVLGTYDKQALANYGVFDEQRYFTPGDGREVFEVDGWKIGIGICEDLWDDTIAEEAARHAHDVIVNLNASPFHVGKQAEREAMMAERARQFAAPVLYVNPVGGQDEVVFDGGSHAVDAEGLLMARAPLFEPAWLSIDLAEPCGEISEMPQLLEQIHDALVLGVRDYVHRNGCRQVLIGLSGGIDSAVTAALACEALGAENVLGILLPSRYSSDHSLTDSLALAVNYSFETFTLPIEQAVRASEGILAEPFSEWDLEKPDVTEENVQARIRGLLLMAISNKTGRMLLTTGNKSEMAVGYATLYGDMAGGFAVLKDVYKTQVFELARYINRDQELIPEHTIVKPPSAELAPDQKDSDSLPDYAELDAILEAHIHDRLSPEEIISRGFDADVVRRVVGLLYTAEYKRRQAPSGREDY